MSFFGNKPEPRRPVAEIVSGLATMVTDLEESNLMAEVEQRSAEDAIVELQVERKLLINEQVKAGSIASNLRSLLGLDLDGDGEADDLDRAIAAFNTEPQPVEVEVDNDE